MSHKKLASMSPLLSILFPPKSRTARELAQPLSLSNKENYRLKKSRACPL